jgi:hypothetical protein
MRQAKTIGELAAELERQQGTKRDYIADTRSLRLEVPADAPSSDAEALESAIQQAEADPRPRAPRLHVADQGDYGLGPIFNSQLQTHVGIPKAYFDKMLHEAPELLATNVNHWLHHLDLAKRRMVRTLDGNARAFLSDAYRPLDHDQLLMAAIPALSAAGVQIISSEVTDRRLYIQAVSPKLEGEVKVGQVVRGGVMIRNSEVGQGRLEVRTFLHELRCLNGWVRDSALRQTHVGRRAEMVEGAAEFYRDDTRKADDAALFLKLRDTVGGLLSEAHFERHLGRMRQATEKGITGDPVKAVEVLSDTLDLRETERGSILRELIQAGDLSAWGLGQAVTATARDQEDYDRGVELEALGSRVLELPKDDWKKIAESAA